MHIYVSANFRVLLAVKEFSMLDMNDKFVHATNGSVQRTHKEYDDEKFNLSLQTMDAYGVIMKHMETAIRGIATKLRTKRRALFTLPNTYEVFGVDFMVEEQSCSDEERKETHELPPHNDLLSEQCGRVLLLEVNPCPSMSLFHCDSVDDVLPQPWALLAKDQVVDKWRLVVN